MSGPLEVKEVKKEGSKQQEAKWERQYAQYGCCIHEDVEEESLEEPAVEAPERM